MTTPLEIEILLHYSTSARSSQYREGDFSAPAVGKAMRRFEELGLIEREHGDVFGKTMFRTKGLELYLEALCAVPLPVNGWTIQKKKKYPYK